MASTGIKVYLSLGKSQGARSSPYLLLSLLHRISIFRKVISRSNLVAAAPAIRPTFQTARNRTEKEKKTTDSFFSFDSYFLFPSFDQARL